MHWGEDSLWSPHSTCAVREHHQCNLHFLHPKAVALGLLFPACFSQPVLDVFHCWPFFGFVFGGVFSLLFFCLFVLCVCVCSRIKQHRLLLIFLAMCFLLWWQDCQLWDGWDHNIPAVILKLQTWASHCYTQQIVPHHKIVNKNIFLNVFFNHS